MPRTVDVGPLRIWAENRSGGDVLIVNLAGERFRHPRSDLSARSALAWRAYRERSQSAAACYPYTPKG